MPLARMAMYGKGDWPDVLCRGGTSMYSPPGEVVAGPLLDAEGCWWRIWIWGTLRAASSTSM